MLKKNFVYIQLLCNGVVDCVGQLVVYCGGMCYMKVLFEFFVECLNDLLFGECYMFQGVIVDDDEGLFVDCVKVVDYGFVCMLGCLWILLEGLMVQGWLVDVLFCLILLMYWWLLCDVCECVVGKQVFECCLFECLFEFDVDIVVFDGLFVIFDEFVWLGVCFYWCIVNIYLGIMVDGLLYQWCGVWVMFDVLYGVCGEWVDWVIGVMLLIEFVMMMGVLFYYVDNGIDFGEVICDVFDMLIVLDDMIFELCWNNFQCSLFLVFECGLYVFVDCYDVGVC